MTRVWWAPSVRLSSEMCIVPLFLARWSVRCRAASAIHGRWSSSRHRPYPPWSAPTLPLEDLETPMTRSLVSRSSVAVILPLAFAISIGCGGDPASDGDGGSSEGGGSAEGG